MDLILIFHLLERTLSLKLANALQWSVFLSKHPYSRQIQMMEAGVVLIVHDKLSID